jgi:site-specific DNA recombinase
VNPLAASVATTRRHRGSVERPARPGGQAPETKVVRAAIYCRKSTDENLHSDFNSLDAQREACQAFITSLKSEGWVALEQTYEDAAVSGGTVDRPALQRLMDDIRHGKVDAIVVVKLDRLSRSLSQFLHLMEFFEEHKIAFCAVTQQINTASSAGRLLVNVLMSFAQFEREIGSERTREKIQAARKKGRFTGGHPPLGYDLDRTSHQLVVNSDEANQVRELYRLYLERQSLIAVVQEVNGRGWTKKSWQNAKGIYRNGRPFDKVHVQRILTNPLYVGRVTLHGDVYTGLQEAIVDEETYKQAQDLLVHNRNGQKPGPETRNKHGALLRGLIKCSICGSAMGHTYTKKGNRLYRFYTCTTRVKQGKGACSTPSFTAADIEAFVVEQIRRVGKDPELAQEVFAEAVQQREDALARLRSERDRLIKQKIQRDEEARRLTTMLAQPSREDLRPGGDSDTLLRRITECESQAGTITARLVELEREIGSHQGASLNLDHLKATLAEFDGIWDVLLPHERALLIHSLIAQVVCSPDSEVQVVFRTPQ